MISIEEIRELAALARLKLSVGEEEALQKDISSILDYVGQVSAVTQGPTLQQDPSRSDLMLQSVMREDELSLTLGSQEDLRAAFPTREGDFNKVRKIIQKDE